MKKSIKVAPKRRGRPPSGGRDPIVPVRISREVIDLIDAWAAANERPLTRSEAIRRLIEIGLKARGKATP